MERRQHLMDFDEFWELCELKYSHLVEDLEKNHPMTQAVIADLKATNASIRNDMYLQEYIRFRCLTMLSVYHEHLRCVLKESAQIDIGEMFSYSDESPQQSQDH